MGWLTFAAASALRTSSSDSPAPASRYRIDLHAHRRLLAAADRHEADAGDLGDLLREHRVGEVVDLRRAAASPSVTASVRIGWSAGLLFEYVGGAGSVRGNRFDAALIAAWTSCWAASMSRSSVNCSVICELPKLETDVICASDGIWPNWRSSGVVTADAIVSGLRAGQLRRHDDRRVVDLRQRGDRQLR